MGPYHVISGQHMLNASSSHFDHMRHRAASHVAVAKLVSAFVRSLCACRCLNCDNLYALHEAGFS